MNESIDLLAYKLSCTDIPDIFLRDKTVAKQYFRQFGRPKRITFRPKQSACTVEFADYKSYLNALDNAGEFEGYIFNVCPKDSPKKPRKKMKKSPVKEPKEKSEKNDPDWDADPDVRAELEAMGAIYRKDYNLRPAKMDVDPVEMKEKKSPIRQTRRKATAAPSKDKTSFTSEQMDLIALLRQRALTVEEKYRVLDARDKLIRLKLKKSGNIKSGPTIGTCPDMCPEKERLMRETQHQVAMYEQVSRSDAGGVAGVMNHSIAVKQYSRSSADQESPLAHELRPVSVLQMTMHYLIHEIMDLSDLPDTNLGEWYHFLWDRTRGIRKDITQQELTSIGSVELVEQCARFHIYCSARLVAEDASVFDQKINSENLTKCLQSLKYMYNDLALKGDLCVNEPEFRAYIILLNLNNSNFIADLQNLPEQVQKSLEVRFALEVHSALDKNNYVRFFKLVQSTTFLNACILLRYFVQIRLKALKSLLKCYSPSSARGQATFPVNELVKLLAFEDAESAIDFLKFYGLSCTATSGLALSDSESSQSLVYLNRSAFYVPEMQYVQERAINVIESKRKLRVGQVVYGAGDSLPEKRYLSHKIQNSFDSNGFLIIENDLLEMVQSKSEITKPQVTEQALKSSDLKYPDEIDNKSVSKVEIETKPDILNKTSIVKKPIVMFPSKLSQFQQKSDKNTSAPLKSTLFTPSFPIRNDSKQFPVTDSSVFTTKPEVQKSVLNKTEPVPINNNNNNNDNIVFKPNIFSKNLPLSNQTESDSPLFTKIAQKIDNFKEKNAFVDCSSSQLISHKQELPVETKNKINLPVSATKSNEIDSLSKSAEIKAKNDEKIKAEALKAEIKRQLAEKQRKIDEEKRRLEQIKAKQLRADVQSVISHLLTKVDAKIRSEALVNLKNRRRRRLVVKYANKWRLNARKSNRKRKALDCGPHWSIDRSLHEVAADLEADGQFLTLSYRKRYRNGNPLDLYPILDEKIPKFNPEIVFRVFYEDLTKLDSNFGISENIFWKVSVSLPDSEEMPIGLDRLQYFVNEHFFFENGQYFIARSLHRLPVHSICIGKIEDALESDANALIFIGDDFNAKFQLRMASILKNYGLHTRLPLVLILQNPESVAEAKIKLQQLQQRQIVSNYVIISDNFSYANLSAIFSDAMRFLASRHSGAPSLRLDLLRDSLLCHLCTELWRRAISFAKWNSNYEKCLELPKIAIELHNEALNRLLNIYLNESVKEYPQFPDQFRKYIELNQFISFPCDYRFFPRFFYGTQFGSYLAHLKEILMCLRLPPLCGEWPPSNQVDLESTIWQFCTEIFKKPEKPFLKMMACILNQFDPQNDFSAVVNVNWAFVIEVVSVELVNELDLRMPDSFNDCQFKELIVVYEKSALEQFARSDWMYLGNPLVQQQLTSSILIANAEIDDSNVAKAEKTKFTLDDWDIDEEIQKARQKLDSYQDLDKVRQQVKDFNRLLADLQDSIQVDRKISQTIGQRLENALKD